MNLLIWTNTRHIWTYDSLAAINSLWFLRSFVCLNSEIGRKCQGVFVKSSPNNWMGISYRSSRKTLLITKRTNLLIGDAYHSHNELVNQLNINVLIEIHLLFNFLRYTKSPFNFWSVVHSILVQQYS